ncbi:peptide-methionine (R)-S-oxide reductase [Catalinimonas alkaloidigena]|uniref:peptide-methionine (R)-S-oxide reductase MsrB n=1 Tax=Catalinimonas alkaloidigena TaxID=1075417 RepID=UPI002407511A|nr:peptide-methionine (R)-S-oxide reductase MsrB [Catalinimonas alkaloidigena]MDF9795983.1 peptide-methionine (R)-S-oxide reductase [Catalinimonas alkaloidigena]
MKNAKLYLLAILATFVTACGINSQAQKDDSNHSQRADEQDRSGKYIGIWEDEMQGEYEYQFSEEEWKAKLSKDEFYILREAGTERAFTSPLNKIKKAGVFYSAATGQPLFTTSTKFESGTGWPSFYEPIDEKAVVLKEDNAYGMTRIEVLDSSSGSHLGHVFPDGPKPTGLRYCMNGDAMLFVAKGEEQPALVKEYLEKHPEEKPEI